ncbi:MAG: hypothetical protein OEY25_08115 [Candidatus Aminicenantes bacterium]|nr:hypothetical protein [Candidatus Aminicenantes bacterium]MDH5707080.1 hypothetical protein [Candidatus Aminicenantes bacterium]
MKSIRGRALIFGLLFVLGLSFSVLFSQEKPSPEKVVGEWNVEIDAGGEYYYLTMTIEKANGGLRGTISEESGYFQNLALSNIEFDGAVLKFEFTAPTPPDDYERVVKAEFKVGENRLEGYMTAEDLDLTVSASATRKK